MAGPFAHRFLIYTSTLLSLFGAGTWTNAAYAERMSLVFIVDGMGYGARGFGVAKTPNMDSLIQGTFAGGGYHGAYSDSAFAGGVIGTPTQQPTVSGPGWSTILTGVWTDRHHVTDNSFSLRDYVNNPPYLQTLEQAVPNIQTVSIVNWAPIDNYIISVANGTASAIDNHLSTSNDSTVTSGAISRVAALRTDQPASVFVGFDDVDAAGHAGGSSSLTYQTAIENTDARIGAILNAVKSRPHFTDEDWLFVITADHGHLAAGGHGGQSTIERTVPFIVAGKHVEQGTLLPFPSAISQADVPPTVLDFHQVSIPAYYFGDPRGDLAGTPGDLNSDGVLNASDWAWFRSQIATPLSGLPPMDAYRLGDLDLDGNHSLHDFVMFKQAYLAAGGVAADLDPQNLPEPTGAFGIGVLVTTWFALGRFHRSRGSGTPLLAGSLSVLLLLGIDSRPARAEVLFAEDFDAIALGPPVEESIPGSHVWTSQPPVGWTINRAGVPGYNNVSSNNGVKEWIGWNYADRDWWVSIAGDQGRSGFTRGSSTILVADPDEWDDATHPGGTYNTFISSPNIPVAAQSADSAYLQFDSSWLPSGNQTASLRVAYDLQPAVTVFQWNSMVGNPGYKGDAINERINLPLHNPAGAQSMRLTWGLTNAGNDWFWAIDNIVAYSGANPTVPSLTVYTNTGEIVLNGGIHLTNVDGFTITSEGGSLYGSDWADTNLQTRQVDRVADPHGNTPGAGNDPGETWETLAATQHQIWDAFLSGFSTFALDRHESLGYGFNPASASRDLVFQYSTHEGQLEQGGVVYATRPLPEDLNGDGSVDASDAGILFAHWGGLGRGDIVPDGIIDAADAGTLFAAWTGDGSMHSWRIVPEPSGSTGLGLAATILLASFRVLRVHLAQRCN